MWKLTQWSSQCEMRLIFENGVTLLTIFLFVADLTFNHMSHGEEASRGSELEPIRG